MSPRSPVRATREGLRDPPPTAALAFCLLDLLAGAPEAALALLIPDDGRVELPGVEIRPERRREVELGVGELPKEEIADALLSPGADEQVGLGRIVEREMRSELVLGVAARRNRPGPHQPAEGLHQIPAAAVVRRDRQGEPRVGGGQVFGAARKLDHAGSERDDVADDLEAYFVLMQPLRFLLERSHEQLPQGGDLLGGPAPVLRAEGEQRQVSDAALAAG